MMYTTSQATVHAPDLPPVRIEQTTDFPASGDVTITVSPEATATFALHLRIPPYASGFTVRVNGESVGSQLQDGFLRIERTWQAGDRVDLQLPMPLRCHANTREVAVVRGPLVYALFQLAQPSHEKYHWHHSFHAAEAELVINPAQPERAIQETALPSTFGTLVGPALRVTGRLVPRTPVFASDASNQTLPTTKDEAFLLLPYANQGAVRGEYQVFSAYQKP